MGHSLLKQGCLWPIRERIEGIRTKRCMRLFEERTKADIAEMKRG